MSEQTRRDKFELAFNQDLQFDFKIWRTTLDQLLTTLPAEIHYELENSSAKTPGESFQEFGVGGSTLTPDRVKFDFDFDNH